MGRLATTFGGREILQRIPYSMYGTVEYVDDIAGVRALIPNTNAPFTNNNDKPFEIHRVIPRGFPLVGTTNVYADVPASDTPLYTVSCTIKDVSRDQDLTLKLTPIIDLIRGDEQTWEFAEPTYLERSQGLHVVVQRALPSVEAQYITAQFCFQGFLLVTAPASDWRG